MLETLKSLYRVLHLDFHFDVQRAEEYSDTIKCRPHSWLNRRCSSNYVSLRTQGSVARLCCPAAWDWLDRLPRHQSERDNELTDGWKKEFDQPLLSSPVGSSIHETPVAALSNRFRMPKVYYARAHTQIDWLIDSDNDQTTSQNQVFSPSSEKQNARASVPEQRVALEAWGCIVIGQTEAVENSIHGQRRNLTGSSVWGEIAPFKPSKHESQQVSLLQWYDVTH